MDARQIDSEHIVERYLANQLDEADVAEFEAYYTRNPDVVRDIERTLRLKEGLAVLRDRAELETLIRARPGWVMPAALAAALAVAIIGAWLWTSRVMPVTVAGTLAQLTDSRGHTVGIANTLVLARMRGASTTVEIELPPERGAIELRMLASAQAERYRVTISVADLRSIVTQIGTAGGLQVSHEGFVTAYLDTAHLQPGRYTIELVPERNASPGVPSDRFVISLR